MVRVVKKVERGRREGEGYDNYGDWTEGVVRTA